MDTNRIQSDHLRGYSAARSRGYHPHQYQDEGARSYLFWSSITLFVATAAAIVAGAFIQVVCDRSQILKELSNAQLGISCILLMAVAAGATLHHYSFKAKLRPQQKQQQQQHQVPLQGVLISSSISPATTPHYS